MAIDTYSELKSAVADFLNRADLTAVIPTFIALAEADMQRNVRHWRMETRATAAIDSQYSAVPGDWLETVRFYLTDNGTSPLRLMSQADLLRQKYSTVNAGGRPAYYAMTGSQFEFFPVPDGAYAGELVYIAKIPALSDASPTNWLLSDSPDIYLYGALAQSAPYLKEDERVSVWAGLYQSALEALNIASEAGKYSGRGLRMAMRGM